MNQPHTLAAAQDPTLADDDHVRFLGDDRWYTVGELRATAAFRVAEQERDLAPYVPPNPYAVAQPQPQSFADRYAADRLHDIEATRAALDATPFEPDHPTVDLHPYAPPDVYAASLKALREKEHRR